MFVCFRLPKKFGGIKKMDKTYQNNKLIRKSILSMFGGSLAAMITVSIAMMTDTILAGALFENGQTAIAAVAIGMPIINIFQALSRSSRFSNFNRYISCSSPFSSTVVQKPTGLIPYLSKRPKV